MPEYKKPFWVWVFCEADGTPSFSRVASGVLTAFSCGWVTAVIRFTHAIPDAVTLGGLGALILVPYGTNKIVGMLSKAA
jgi:hypothetical protein